MGGFGGSGPSLTEDAIRAVAKWLGNSGRQIFGGTIKPDPNGAPNDMSLWRQSRERNKSNCYEVAMWGQKGISDETLAAPGNAAGYFYPIKQLNEQSLIALTEADGKATGANTQFAGKTLPQGKEGYYLVAAYMSKGGDGKTQDYHYIRRNQDGTWAGKPGTDTPVTYQTPFGQPVADAPSTIGFPPAPRYDKVGYFYVKASGANVGADVAISNLANGSYRQGPEITGADGKPIASIPTGASIEQAISLMEKTDNSPFMGYTISFLSRDVDPKVAKNVEAARENIYQKKSSVRDGTSPGR